MKAVFVVVVLGLLQLSSVQNKAIEFEEFDWEKPVPIHPNAKVPDRDGRLHVYALPVGQGDAHIIQCPNGDLSVIDLGSTDSVNAGFWSTNHIDFFLQGSYHLIRSILLTHNHDDHYRYLPSVLHSGKGLTGLQNIYVSCLNADMHVNVQNWLRNISAENRVRTFNGGKSCGPNGIACGNLALCPSDSAVVAKVLAANMANCVNSNKNIDSIVFKLSHGPVSMLFNGDFEDSTTNVNENGPQKQMADFYGAELRVTVYKISHHGAQNLANKPVICNAHQPKAIVVSGNPWSTYRHPRCDVVDYFINTVRTLCRPTETNSGSANFCSTHPMGNVPTAGRLLATYTCGELSAGQRRVTNNQLAIYTTVPEQNLLNVVEFVSDGTRWGFVNNYYPR